MDEYEKRVFAAEIETTLVIAFLPAFLNYNIEEDYIHVVISSSHFKNLNVSQRTSLVYSKLRIHDKEILDKFPVIVEVYTKQEIEDLIDFLMEL